MAYPMLPMRLLRRFAPSNNTPTLPSPIKVEGIICSFLPSGKKIAV